VKGRIKVKKGVTLFVIDEGEIIAEMERETFLLKYILTRWRNFSSLFSRGGGG
jgi:hypothetical protein